MTIVINIAYNSNPSTPNLSSSAIDDMQGAIAMNNFQLSMLKKDIDLGLLSKEIEDEASQVMKEIAYFEIMATEYEVNVLERQVKGFGFQEGGLGGGIILF